MRAFYMGRHEAEPTHRGRKRAGTLLPLLVAFVMLLGSVAWADILQVDGDGLVPVEDDPNVVLGNVCVGATTGGNSVLLAIRRTGNVNQNVFANSATVAVSAGTPSSPNVSATFPSDASIVLPSNWTTIGNNQISADTATSLVAVTGDGPTGNKTATVVYTASGARATDGQNHSLTKSLTITWTVIACDSTPPVITPNVTGTLGNNGWHTSDVSVSWAVNDPESTVSSASGCGNSSVTSDTPGQTFTCSATSAGGTNSVSVTIKRDTVAPSITGTATSSPNGNGWYNTDVTVDFTCGSDLSGVVSCGPDQTLTGDGAGQSVSGTAVDAAGNTSAPFVVGGINIDKTAPVVSASKSVPPNANGWNKTNVTVSFSGTDGGSGIASCSGDVVLSSEGAGQSASGSCSDLAGNSASATASGINIDKTAPSYSVLSRLPAANGNGWNNEDVNVSFGASDGLSGLGLCDLTKEFLSEGSNQSFTGTCSDRAGNTAEATVSGINIDKTAPVVNPTVTPTSIVLGGSGTVSPGASDGLSGVASTWCGSINALSVGYKSVMCTATDLAGNVGMGTANYRVVYDFSGFLRPVDNLPTVNRVKAGSAIPVKFKLGGYQGMTIFASGYPGSKMVACSQTDPVDYVEETVTAGSSSLSYDSSSDQYNYVWKTDKAWAGQCRQMQIKLDDGSIHYAMFHFTK